MPTYSQVLDIKGFEYNEPSDLIIVQTIIGKIWLSPYPIRRMINTGLTSVFDGIYCDGGGRIGAEFRFSQAQIARLKEFV